MTEIEEKKDTIFGYWASRENESAKARISEIDKYIDSYNSIISNITSLSGELNNCSLYIDKAYDSVKTALVIGDSTFSASVDNLKNLSKKFEESVNSLNSVVSSIQEEIKKLQEEKKEQQNNLIIREWVSL